MSRTESVSRFRCLFSSTSFFFILFVCSFSVSALTNQWAEFANFPTGRNWVGDEQGLWTETGTYSTIAAGTAYQPLIFDADSDGVQEIIITDGNLLKVYEWKSGGLSLQDDRNMLGTQKGTPQLIVLNSTAMYIAGLWGNNLTVINISSTGIQQIQTKFINLTLRTGIRCVNYSGTNGCYFGTWNGTHGLFTTYSVLTNDYVVSPINSADVFSTYKRGSRSPSIADIDKDGHLEVVMAADYNNDGSEGIIVWDITSDNLDTGFSTDGVIDNIRADAQVSSVVLENIEADYTEYLEDLASCWFGKNIFTPLYIFEVTNCYIAKEILFNMGHYGGGTAEVLVSYHAATDDKSYIAKITSDGTIQKNVNIRHLDSGVGFAATSSNLLYQNFVGDSDYELCLITRGRFNGAQFRYTAIDCVDPVTFTNIYSWKSNDVADADYYYIDDGSIVVAANMDTDDTFEIITGGAIIDLNSSGSISDINITGSPANLYDNFPAVSDINGDGYLDMCSVGTSTLTCAVSAYVNQPPEFLLMDVDTGNPVLVNNTIVFSSSQDDGQYTNDGSEDAERLILKIPSGVYINGSWSLAEPSVNWTPSAIGTFKIYVYLQDFYNSDDFEEYKVYYVTTTKNEAIGYTSGQGGGTSGGSSAGETDPAVVEEFIRGFGIEPTTLLKLVLFSVIFFMVLIFAGKYTSGLGSGVSTVTITAAAVIMIVAGVVTGMIPAWVVAVGVIALIGVAVMVLFGRGGR